MDSSDTEFGMLKPKLRMLERELRMLKRELRMLGRELRMLERKLQELADPKEDPAKHPETRPHTRRPTRIDFDATANARQSIQMISTIRDELPDMPPHNEVPFRTIPVAKQEITLSWDQLAFQQKQNAAVQRNQELSTLYPNATQPFRSLPTEILLEIYGYVCLHPDPIASNGSKHHELRAQYIDPAAQASDRLGLIAEEAFYKNNTFQCLIKAKARRHSPGEYSPYRPRWRIILPPQNQWHLVRYLQFDVRFRVDPYWLDDRFMGLEYALQKLGEVTKAFNKLEFVSVSIVAGTLFPPLLDYWEDWAERAFVDKERVGRVEIKTKEVEVKTPRFLRWNDEGGPTGVIGGWITEPIREMIELEVRGAIKIVNG